MVTLYDRCITRGIVGSVLPVVYGNGNRIIQTPGEVVISYEMVHDTRVISLDGRPHVGPKIRQYLGDSRGHWEGNTLVVETTNFTDQTSIGGGNGNGLRHSADMKMTERITRVGAGRAAVRDARRRSEDLREPFTISLPLMSPPGIRAAAVRVPRRQLHAAQLAQRASARKTRRSRRMPTKGIVRPRKSIQQNLDAGARPIPGRSNPNDEE